MFRHLDGFSWKGVTTIVVPHTLQSESINISFNVSLIFNVQDQAIRDITTEYTD